MDHEEPRQRSFLLRHTQVLIVLSPLGCTRVTGQRLRLTSPHLLIRRKLLQANSGVIAIWEGKLELVHYSLLDDDNMHGCEFNTVYRYPSRSGIFTSQLSAGTFRKNAEMLMLSTEMVQYSKIEIQSPADTPINTCYYFEQYDISILM